MGGSRGAAGLWRRTEKPYEIFGCWGRARRERQARKGKMSSIRLVHTVVCHSFQERHMAPTNIQSAPNGVTGSKTLCCRHHYSYGRLHCGASSCFPCVLASASTSECHCYTSPHSSGLAANLRTAWMLFIGWTANGSTCTSTRAGGVQHYNVHVLAHDTKLVC